MISSLKNDAWRPKCMYKRLYCECLYCEHQHPELRTCRPAASLRLTSYVLRLTSLRLTDDAQHGSGEHRVGDDGDGLEHHEEVADRQVEQQQVRRFPQLPVPAGGRAVGRL